MSCPPSHFRLFRFQVRYPDYPLAVASGALDTPGSSSSIYICPSDLWLACCELSPLLSSATAATLVFHGLRGFKRPTGILNGLLWMVLILISFLQCFHPWFVKVYRVHCFLAFRLSISFWSILVCASAQTLCIISCRGAAGFLAAFSSFFFAWYTLFSLAVYFGFFTTAAVHQQKYTLRQMHNCCVRIPGTGY